MKMQAIPVSNNNVQAPRPVYVSTTSNSPPGSYHDYEFVDQGMNPSPVPTYQAPPQYVHAQMEGKGGYPEVPPPMSAQRDPRMRYNQADQAPSPSRNNGAGWNFGVFGFFQRMFSDEEGERIEQAIVDEAKATSEADEVIENEQYNVDREERRLAWDRIERLPTDDVKMAAIQAEISRADGHGRQASERRAERARQRENAREELTNYRSQRAKVRALTAIAYSVTALVVFHTVWGSFGCSAKPQKGGMVSRVLVAKNSQGSSSAPSSSPPHPPQQAQGSSSRETCGWRRC